MIKLPKLQSFDFKKKTVLVRIDSDIPLIEGKVGDDTRIKACLPTIEYLLENEAKVILMGHLGRPNGKVVEELSLKPVVEKLKELLGAKVQRYKGAKVQLKVQDFPVYILDKNLWLLENLRFYSGEESNSLDFAKNLSLLGDFYVNEAFAASHRGHASIVGVPKLLPHCAGFNFIKEVENLSKVLENPKRPVVFIIGGAKPETKLTLVGDLVSKSDFILIGGLLPLSYQSSASSSQGIPSEYSHQPKNVVIANLTEDKLDIDGNSIEKFKEIILNAKTIVWNGPMGKFEVGEMGEKGTRGIAEAIAESKAFKVVGGGDTIVALNKFKLLSKIDFTSLGGGAMLEFLAKSTLPGIQAISNQSSAIRQKYTED